MEEEGGEDEESDGESHSAASKKRARRNSASSESRVPVPPERLRWFYVDKGGVERGPFAPGTMLRWHRRGYFAFNDSPLRREDETDAVPLSKRSSAPSFFAARLPRASDVAAGTTSRWYYLDARDDEHGPFTSDEMRAWFEAGHFKPTLRVRMLGEPEEEYACVRDRDVPWTKPLPKPAMPTPPHAAAAAVGAASFYPSPYGAYPPAPYPAYPPAPLAPYPGAPPAPYPGGAYAPAYPHAGGFEAYGGAAAAAAPAARVPPSAYAQTFGVSQRGRSTHAVNVGLTGAPHVLPDRDLRQMAHFMPTSDLDRWQQQQNQRQRMQR